jgi:hypothetical protein
LLNTKELILPKAGIRKNLKTLMMVAIFSLVLITITSAIGQVKHNYIVGPGVTTCDSLGIMENDFNNYLEKIQAATWRYTQSMHMNRPYGFRKADFYSCDVITGFLVIEIDDDKYIYTAVPVSLWEEFTKTSDPDAFIKTNIEDKFEHLQ